MQALIISRKIWILLIGLTFLSACYEYKTQDPEDAYMHWIGIRPAGKFKVVLGEYWQSPHFTREYICYLKIEHAQDWFLQQVAYFNLIQDKETWSDYTDAPDWFRPTRSFVRFKAKSSFDQGSRYFYNPTTQECFIVAIQL